MPFGRGVVLLERVGLGQEGDETVTRCHGLKVGVVDGGMWQTEWLEVGTHQL